MKRLIGVTEMRDLLTKSTDVYEIVDVINQKAAIYACEVTKGLIEKEANEVAKKLRHRVEVTRKLKERSNTKTFIKI